MLLRVTILALFALCVSLTGANQQHSRVKRVVNGTEVAAPGNECSWPFITIVEKRCVATGDIPFRCGGSIISENRVITNKQCVMPDFPRNIGCDEVVIRIIAGARNFYDVHEPTRQIRWVSHVLEHEDADLAVLVLDGNLQLQNHVVETIDITTVDHQLNDTAMAAGWGTSDTANPWLYTINLKEKKLFVRHYQDQLLFYSTSVTEVFQEQSGVNQGDSGGPIVVYKGNQNVCQEPRLVAVTNCFYPIGNCGHWRQGRHPNLYFYQAWIQEMIAYVPPEPEVDAAVNLKSHGVLVVLSLLVTTLLARIRDC